MTGDERTEFKQMAKDVAVLKAQYAEFIKPTLITIVEKIDVLSFYTKDEVDTKITTVEKNLEKNLEKTLEDVRKRRWYENTLSAAMGVIISLVATFFFNYFSGGR